ncbi:MAG: YccF domain-containing protein [Caldilinea sp.]|nr:YccF domain-containing protein [Caldilinea sp.]MCB0057024.1 YccF domain-containing protein [Caldilineaceae bacterium]MCB0049612.1 YccF domain-containing protein [Caldilinea sp.]MCB0069566.1 YccF domain-containing protein [Caldilineaceae bacterium]MCB0134770.1 YccF domain-containing protein [Caldilineaceae bacterium]
MSNRGDTPVVAVRQGPGCLIQILWFVFIGWWLGSFAVGAAYVMFLLIVTIPVGIAILNNIPMIMALRQPDRLVTAYGEVSVPQHNFLLRALWFIFVGWWLAGIALTIGYALCMTIIGLPFGFVIFDMVPAMLTLRRS